MTPDPVRTVFYRIAILRAVLSFLAIAAVLLPWDTQARVVDVNEGYASACVRFLFASAGPLFIAMVSLVVIAHLERRRAERLGGLDSVGFWVLDVLWQILPLAAWFIVPSIMASPGCGGPAPGLPEPVPHIGQMLSVATCAACALLVLGAEPLLLFLALRKRSLPSVGEALAGA